MRPISPEMQRIRSNFLRDVRDFFFQRDYIEAETPLLNRRGGVDPFLDPMRVEHTGYRKSVEAAHTEDPIAGYLVTSPEYNLKILLSENPVPMFQIAHCFRGGDSGSLHSQEFLMLEWYRPGANEFELMRECRELLAWTAQQPYAKVAVPPENDDSYRSVASVMREALGCDLNRGNLERALVERGLLGRGEVLEELRYDEIFFSLFLNYVEGDLGADGPEFLYHYPREMAALAEVRGDIARRFECYWHGVELANGYFELRSRTEQEARFQGENELRRALGKPEMEPDPDFLAALDRGLPECSGIALGLDRLLMIVRGEKDLSEVSPFFGS